MHAFIAYTLATQAGAVTDTDTPIIADPSVTQVNSHPIFPVPVQAYMAYGFGDTHISRMKLSTPKIRAINNVNLRPLDLAAAQTSRPPMVEYFHHPLGLNPIDENQILTTTTGATAAALFVGVWFGDGNFNVPQGDMFALHGTLTLTTVTGAWASGPLTLDQPLPAGRYSVIGGDCYGTNMVFWRVIFPNQVWRPGGIAGTAASYINTRYQRWGALGEWGQFESALLPNIDTISSSGGSVTIDVTLDIVRVR
jgi:hypothetical protein